MATQKAPSRSLVTPEFRMSYVHLITPRPYMEDGQPSGIPAWQTQAIFTEDALKKFMLYNATSGKYEEVDFPALLLQLAQEAWPGKDIVNIFKNQFDKHGNPGKGWPLKRGDVLAAAAEARGKKGDHYKGMRVMSLSAKSKSRKGEDLQPPSLSAVTGQNTFIGLSRASDADMAKAKNYFVGGNYGFATISVQARDVDGTKFLSTYLNGVRFTREGQKLGGQNEMDRFDGIHGGQSAHNPTEGMDEEIPF